MQFYLFIYLSYSNVQPLFNYVLDNIYINEICKQYHHGYHKQQYIHTYKYMSTS